MLLSNLRVAVSAVVVGIFVAAYLHATTFFGMGRWFPMIVTVLGAVVAVLNLGYEIWRNVRARRQRRAAVAAGRTQDEPVLTNRALMDTQGAATTAEFLSSAKWFGVALTCPAAMFVLGAVAGASLWVAAFLLFVVKRSVLAAVISGGAVVLVLLLYSHYFNLRLPGPLFLS